MMMNIGFNITHKYNKNSCDVKFRVCSCYISFFYRDGVVSKHRVHVSWVQLLSKTVKVQEAFKCQLSLRKINNKNSNNAKKKNVKKKYCSQISLSFKK